jgi:hypothetical protein
MHLLVIRILMQLAVGAAGLISIVLLHIIGLTKTETTKGFWFYGVVRQFCIISYNYILQDHQLIWNSFTHSFILLFQTAYSIQKIDKKSKTTNYCKDDPKCKKTHR